MNMLIRSSYTLKQHSGTEPLISTVLLKIRKCIVDDAIWPVIRPEINGSSKIVSLMGRLPRKDALTAASCRCLADIEYSAKVYRNIVDTNNLIIWISIVI